MTVGQGDPASINAAASTNDTARRIAMLQDAGHQWMDPSLQVAMANSSMPDHQLVPASDQFKSVLTSVEPSWLSSITSDPVLQKAPSSSMKFAQWVGDNQGFLPVEQPNVSVIQQQLQKKGFAAGLPTDGVWTSQWNSEWQNAWYAHVQNQQDNVGQIAPVHKVAHGFLSSLMPSHWIPGIVGAVKSIPGDVRSLEADAWGLGNAIGSKISGHDAQGDFGHTWAANAATVENLGNQGKKVTSEDILAHPYARVVNDVGTLLLALPYGKVGSEVARTIGQDVFKDGVQGALTRSLPESVATRGPGVIARTLVKDERGTGFGLFNKLNENRTILGQLHPVVQRLIGHENAGAYAFRRMLAQPMRNPVINLGVRTGQYGSLLGAATTGVAAAEGRAGDKKHGIGGGVYGAGTISGTWGHILDGLAAVGRPTIGMDPSKVVGSLVSDTESVYDKSLGGPVGIPALFDRAMHASTKTGTLRRTPITFEKMIDQHGNTAVNEYMNFKINQYAAANYAKGRMAQDVRNGGQVLSGQAEKDAFQAYAHTATADPQVWQQARDELVQNPQALFEAFAKDSVNMQKDAGQTNGLANLIAAHGPAHTLFDSYGHMLITPESYALMADERANAAIDAEMAVPPQQFGPGHQPLYVGSGATTPEGALSGANQEAYGQGIVATTNRKNATFSPNAYMVQHGGRPQFRNLEDTASQKERNIVRNALTSKDGKAEHGAGKSLVESPPAYVAARRLTTHKWSTVKQMLDSYQASLKQAGNLSDVEIQDRMNGIMSDITEGKTGYRYHVNGGHRHVITDTTDVTATPIPKPEQVTPTAGFLALNGEKPGLGKLGLARNDTMLAEDFRNKADEMAQLLNAAGVPTGQHFSELAQDGVDVGAGRPALKPLSPSARDAAITKVFKESNEFLIREAGLDGRELSIYQNDPAKLVGLLYRQAMQHATEAHLPIDAPDSMRALYQQVQDEGYKVVFGTDIGHYFTPPAIDPMVLKAQSNWRRNIMSKLGMNNEHYATNAPGTYAKIRAAARIQQLANDGKIKLPPGISASNLLTTISTNAKDVRGTDPIADALFGLTKGIFHKRAIRQELENAKANGEQITQAQAEQRVKDGVLHGTGLNAMSQKDFVKAAMTVPPELKSLYSNLGVEDDLPLMSERDAMTVHREYLKALASRPAAMMGLSKLEDAFRSSMSFMGAAGAKYDIPVASQLAQRMAVLPNDLIRIRDKMKFTYSPLFDARRIVKTALKMGLEGVHPTTNPLKAMQDKGVQQQALKYLDRLYPEEAQRGAGFDVQDRVLQQNSIFGYNVRHFMAYAANELKAQGLTDEQVLGKVNHMFTYGDRTALERSVGTIWYPFSFEKTLYRNLGGYLVDHNASKVLLLNALSAYHTLDRHEDIQGWLDKHLPVAKELEKLNAFADGVGLGQFGGINSPLFNMLLPQHNKEPLNQQLLTSMVPAYNDLNFLLIGHNPKTGQDTGGAIQKQLTITRWAAQSALDTVTGGGPKGLEQRHPLETPEAQQEDGYTYRNTLIMAAQRALDYNYHHPNAQLSFPDSDAMPPNLRGAAVTRQALGQLAQVFYPAYDPGQAQAMSIKKTQARDAAIQAIYQNEPAKAAAYETFSKLADSVKGHIQHDEYDVPQLSALTQGLRTYVTNLSEQDPTFYKFYNTYYRSAFGPLENLQ